MQAASEGVIKFRLEHAAGPLPGGADLAPLQRWFCVCRALDLIGRHPQRYQGAAYGNISLRADRGFLVTGTQTGAKPALEATDIAWVRSFDITQNRVASQGPARPSSESLTHGQLYALDPAIGAVIHVHSPLVWQRREDLALPITAPQAAYGTPEMAQEVERLMRLAPVRESGVICMGGHEDGILVFAHTPDQAGYRLLQTYRLACEAREPADRA